MYVTYYIIAALYYGVFPDSMKCAIVRATLKKPNLDSDILNNYRPISNLSFLSKVLEKCVHQQLTNYITNSNLFAKYQSGYIEKDIAVIQPYLKSKMTLL